MIGSEDGERIVALEAKVDELLRRLAGAERFRAPFYPFAGNWALTYLDNGQPFFVDTSDTGLTPWLIMGGHWEAWADRVVSSYVRPGMKIVDVGANVGYYATKWGAMIGPSGELHAFEPNPALSEFIHQNFTLSGLHYWCRYYPHAVGADYGEATLTLTDRSTGLGTLRDVEMPPGGVRTHKVKVVTLDGMLKAMTHADLIKIDVEGYEPNVIDGAKELVARSPACAFHLEVQTGWEVDGRSIRETLKPLTDGRLVFVIGGDSSLTRIEPDAIRDFVFGLPSGLADFFICPETHLDRVAAFLKN